MEHFNGLTPAQAERLAMLAEECGEVIQIVGKILRHGYESWHPNDHTVTNRDLLGKEIGDMISIVSVLCERDGVHEASVADLNRTWARKLRFAHHQEQGA